MNTWHEIRNESLLWEDGCALVLNKPAGISVMGERHETDLDRLAQEAGEKLYWVHRIDKVTSGAVLFAKDLKAHGDLTRQFNRRSVDKAYLVITRSHGLPDQGTIELPLSVGAKNRVRVAAPRASITADEATGSWTVPPDQVFTHTGTYPSTTTFAKVWEDERHTLLVAAPVTGRRHQIRVHLAWIGHPIEGDPLFDKTSAARAARTCLHSWRLAFDDPCAGNARVEVGAPPGEDFWAPVGGRLPGGTPDSVLRDAGPALQKLKAASS